MLQPRWVYSLFLTHTIHIHPLLHTCPILTQPQSFTHIPPKHTHPHTYAPQTHLHLQAHHPYTATLMQTPQLSIPTFSHSTLKYPQTYPLQPRTLIPNPDTYNLSHTQYQDTPTITLTPFRDTILTYTPPRYT